jgi:hypothetical protein
LRRERHGYVDLARKLHLSQHLPNAQAWYTPLSVERLLQVLRGDLSARKHQQPKGNPPCFHVPLRRPEGSFLHCSLQFALEAIWKTKRYAVNLHEHSWTRKLPPKWSPAFAIRIAAIPQIPTPEKEISPKMLDCSGCPHAYATF